MQECACEVLFDMASSNCSILALIAEKEKEKRFLHLSLTAACNPSSNATIRAKVLASKLIVFIEQQIMCKDFQEIITTGHPEYTFVGPGKSRDPDEGAGANFTGDDYSELDDDLAQHLAQYRISDQV